MTITKTIFTWLIASIKKELTIQKPTQEQVAMCNCKCNQKKSKALWLFRFIAFLIVAPIIFVVLAGMIL